MKKLLFILSICGILLANDKIIKIGVTPYPTGDIVGNVKDLVEKEGFKLEIIEFDSYIIPNHAVNDGELDANFTQNRQTLRVFNEEFKTDLIDAGTIFIGPIAGYSKKIKNIKDLPQNAVIYISSEPISCTRALDLLAENKIISFPKHLKNKQKTILDISENPLNVKIKEIESAQLIRVLDECDLAIVDTNYALVAGLNPMKDSIIHEDTNSDYVCVLAVKKENESSAKTKALLKAMQSKKMREYLNTHFKDVLIPSFKEEL